jgi:ribosome-associated toxin RatA of RatAB toxin-antitoxin module
MVDTGVVRAFLLAALWLATGAVAGADCLSWRMVRETAEGPLFHRCRPGSVLDEVMIETRLPAAPERLYRLVTDYDAFAGLIPDVAESRVLETAGRVQWVYHRLHFPGPVADRAYILQSSATATDTPPGAWRVEWALSERVFPQVDPGAGVRPDSLSGFWEIEAGAVPNACLARYAVHVEPGGRLPDWLVMRMTDRYVQRVVAAIRRHLED